MQELAPTGKLRIAVAVAPSPSAQFAIKDGAAGKPRRRRDPRHGAGQEARRSGRDHGDNSSREVQNSAADNKWDVAFLTDDDERKIRRLGNAYHLLQSTFLVAPGSKMQSVKDADAAGIGIGGVANTATFRAATKATPKATHIEFAGVDPATAAMNEGHIQAIGLSRESLGGLAPGCRDRGC